ncbi:hypothetical protein C0992_009287 [Termitomyces sp. T32_za158]|nr:hypothetical protein C0992_009287 [Termitomyces sp. T32_za158]
MRQSLLTALAKQQIPIPGLFDRPLDSLSSTELEHLARKAWMLRQNWAKKSPVVRKTLIMKLDSLPYQDGGVPPSFTFIEKAGKRYLLTFMVKDRTREGYLYNLQCWDLEVSPPRCIAERKLNHRNLAVNKNVHSLASLAVLTPSIEILGIDHSAEDPVSGFYTVSKIQNSTERPIALNDSLVITQNDRQQLYLVRIHEDDDHHIELRSGQPV